MTPPTGTGVQGTAAKGSSVTTLGDAPYGGSARLHLALGLFGAALLFCGLLVDWAVLLQAVGFPAGELSKPWVRADLRIVRATCVVFGALLVGSRMLLWGYQRHSASVAERIHAFASDALSQRLVVPLCLAALILATVILQLLLYVLGYTAFSADDFGRPLSAAYWLRNRQIDLGMDGWLGLAGSGWLPFSDFVLAAALAIHGDLFVTPRILNLILSSLAVVSVYFLGRELFGRAVGLVTALLFTFQPWHVWLGMSGMSSDLPSIVLIPIVGLYFIRWLRHDDNRALLAAAAALALANGFRYENWLFAAVFSGVIVFVGIGRWMQHGIARGWLVPSLCALVILISFPVFWMTASYIKYGDWLPALHGINAFMVAFMASETARVETQMSIPLMAAGSFPFEIALSAAGIAWFGAGVKLRPYRLYLVTLIGTAALFTLVFRGQLAAWLHIARYLVGFVVLALPFAGWLIVRLFTMPHPRRAEGILATAIVLLTVGAFDIGRALNYPASFPRDAIDTGWMIRSLQRAGTVPSDARILIERAPDFGDLSVVALANRPERFIVLNELAYRRMALSGLLANRPAPMETTAEEGVRGTICGQDFAVPACRDSIVDADVTLVILSTPGRVESFAGTFGARSWNIGRYHVFDMRDRHPAILASRPGPAPPASTAGSATGLVDATP